MQPLVPEHLLRDSIASGALVPRFLDERDIPWLRALIEEHARFVGRPVVELAASLRRPDSGLGPKTKRMLAARVLSALCPPRVSAVIPPPKARAALFGAAARGYDDRSAVLLSVGRSLGVSAKDLESALLADLASERRVTALSKNVGPQELALRANSLLAQGFLSRSVKVSLAIEGHARGLVRRAHLSGLICTVTRAGGPDSAVLELSGPFSLFRRTLVYGRALAGLVPELGCCRKFKLRAECRLGRALVMVELATGDPLFPREAPRAFDSALEERFAKDMARWAPSWDVVREPEPLCAGPALVFPDFALQHRLEPGRRWLLEIVGFWTPDYLRKKLESYRAVRAENLILCVDDSLNCGDGEVSPGARVIRFRRRVDPAAVLAVIEPKAPGASSPWGFG